MKIGLILPYLKRRGTEKQTLRIAQGLKNKGWDPIVFNIQGWGDFAEEFESTGVSVVNVGPERNRGLKTVDLNRSADLGRLLLQYRCSIALSRANLSHPVAISANHIAKIPLVLVRSSAIKPIKGYFYQKAKILLRNYLIHRNVSKIVTVSQESAVALEKYFLFHKGKITSIPNGVDSVRIKYLSKEKTETYFPKDTFNICFMGSIDIYRKGLDILLKAMNQLVYKNGRSTTRLHILGTGEDQLKLCSMINQLSLQDHIVLHGEVVNPYPLLKQADLFILPSRREGMPNALLEAMSLQICCLATDCQTGPAEIIEHEINGLLVPTENPSIMTEEILRVIDDDYLRSKLACNAVRTIETTFTADRMVDSYHGLLYRLVK